MVDYKADVNRKTIKEKVSEVEHIKAEIGKYKTVALINLNKLPDALFQASRKKIRENGGKVFVLRKPIITRVLASVAKLAPYVKECEKPVALIVTNQSPYELNKFFKQNKKRRAAKTGEIAPFEIIVPEGDTDLPPGPALSELKSAGLNVQIKAGKIVISKDSVVAKVGEAITDPKAKALQKLNIMPFETQVNLLFGYDGHYVYSVDLLNIDDTLNTDLMQSMRDALNLSINACYPTQQNIALLLQEAYRQSLNVSINGNIYSSSSMEQLLSSAVRQGLALDSLNK
ncbi:MAG: 50S ribosomal protein L10 [Candidatus Micrarchaeota archaeon]|nr:50S ribosomal protein L10 [Candidatus Micrarchaeota archaeon]